MANTDHVNRQGPFGKWTDRVKSLSGARRPGFTTANYLSSALAPSSTLVVAHDGSDEWWKAVATGSAFSLLREIAEDGDVRVFKRALDFILGLLDIDAPPGVLKRPRPTSLAKRGRPVSSERQKIYQIWLNAGRPSVHANKVAQKFYGPKFTAANAIRRKAMVVHCRGLIEREEIAQMEAEVQRLRDQLRQHRSYGNADQKDA